MGMWPHEGFCGAVIVQLRGLVLALCRGSHLRLTDVTHALGIAVAVRLPGTYAMFSTWAKDLSSPERVRALKGWCWKIDPECGTAAGKECCPGGYHRVRTAECTP